MSAYYKEEQRDGEWVPVRVTLEELLPSVGEVLASQCDGEGQSMWEKRWHVSQEIGPYQVSTVFLGVSPQYETMVFCGNEGKDWEHVRYSTRAEAIKGHTVVVRRWQDVFESNVLAYGREDFWHPGDPLCSQVEGEEGYEDKADEKGDTSESAEDAFTARMRAF